MRRATCAMAIAVLTGCGGLLLADPIDASTDAFYCANVTECDDVPICHVPTCAMGRCFYSGLRTGDSCEDGGVCDMGVCK